MHVYMQPIYEEVLYTTRTQAHTSLPRMSPGVSSATEVDKMRWKTERDRERAVLARRPSGIMKYVRNRTKISKPICKTSGGGLERHAANTSIQK